MRVRPILFNTDMVRAILDGRKTVTRRVIKTSHKNAYGFNIVRNQSEIVGVIDYDENEIMFDNYTKPPCYPNDILYVRETWLKDGDEYYYRADFDSDYLIPCETLSGGYPAYCRNHPSCDGCMEEPTRLLWHPSIHMPKEAARIWLKVTDVRVERLQDMTVEDCKKEGAETDEYLDIQEEAGICGIQCETLKHYFAHSIWNSTIKKKDLPMYGWDASPWVWLIEFERCEKPEED